MGWPRCIAATIVWAIAAVGFALVMWAMVSFIRLELFNPFTSAGGRVMLLVAGAMALKLILAALKDERP